MEKLLHEGELGTPMRQTLGPFWVDYFVSVRPFNYQTSTFPDLNYRVAI